MTNVRARSVVSLARIEAVHLSRSVPVLSGLMVSGVAMWLITYRSQPLWWSNDWRIGYGQTVISLTVLVGAQLATARSRRDGLQELYESFPTSTGQRTLAHLIGVLGAAPAAVLLVGVAAGAFALQGALGTPDLTTLIGGILLVLAGGVIGVAIGSRFPHPLAGVLGAFVWLLPFSQSNRFNSAIPWLFPWVKPAQLSELPRRLAGYPPALAHALELAAIVVLAGVVALAITSAARRHRVGLLVAGAAGLAGLVVTCLVQLQPIPTRDIDRVVSEAANTGAAQHCTTSEANGHNVRYCLYPGVRFAAPNRAGACQRSALANARAAGAPADHLANIRTRHRGFDADPRPLEPAGDRLACPAPERAGKPSVVIGDLRESGTLAVRRTPAIGRSVRPCPRRGRMGGGPSDEHRPPYRAAADAMRAAEPGPGGNRDLACGSGDPFANRTISGPQRQLLGCRGGRHRRRRLDLSR